MNPLRWEVLLVGFVLALPVLALGVRGDLGADEVVMRLPWCLAAGWGAVALLRLAGAPRTPARATTGARRRPQQPPSETEPAA